MSSPRLVPIVALAAAALAVPASASAALSQFSDHPVPDAAYGSHLDDFGVSVTNMTADNILGPNEDVNVSFPLIDDGQDANGAPLDFAGGNGLLSRLDNSDLSINTTSRTFGASQGGVATNAPSGGGSGYFQLHTGSNLVCGTSVPLKLDLTTVAQPSLNKTFNYTLPTGVHGAFHRTASNATGQVVTDGGTIQSPVDVSQGGLTKGLRIHIDSLEHRFSTYWLEIILIAPSGKKVVLMDHQGSLDSNTANRPKTLTDVTFSDTAVNGSVPLDAADALAASYQHIVMQPKESLSSLDGEPLDGTWKLQVHDISQPLSNRSSRGRGYAFSGNEMAQVGDWQLDTANALCDGTPQAWFGGSGSPLILNPAGGTLDGSASMDPSLGGSITSYQWDLDGNGSVDTTTTTPTVPYPAVSTAPYNRQIGLKVVDNQGNTSPLVTRSVVFSNPPVVSDVTMSPTSPIAGTEVTLDATATDADAGDTMTYSWDLNGDGVYGDVTGASVKWTWDTSGPQTVRLKVTDSRGAPTYYWRTVSIANTNPVARMTYTPIPAVVGQQVTFSGATSTDADGSIVMYEWDLDGNATLDDVVSDKPTATYTFTDPGEHIVRLRVTDNTGGTDEIDTPVWVTGPPVGVISATPSSPLVNETVTFSAAQSHDSDAGGSIVKYEWDLDGNGSYEVSGATAVSATKAYPNAGNVSVRLRLTDNDGATSVTPFSLTVRNPAPAPTPTPTPTPKPGSGGGTIPSTPGATVPAVTGGNGTTITNAVVVDPAEASLITTDPDAELHNSVVAPNGFGATMSVASKQKAKKAYKQGIAVSIKATDKGKIAVKAMVTTKVAKALGIKTKAKLLSIGSGTLSLTKASGKFYVRFNKKYLPMVKKAKSVTVSLRGVVKSSDGTAVAVGKNVTIVK